MGVLAPAIFALAIIAFVVLIILRARKEQD
jgi:hypothetical protein